MSLNQNPFLQQVMSGIDMLAASKEAERRDLRDQEMWNQRFEKQKEYETTRTDKRLNQQEYGNLTAAIQDYAKNIQAGAEPDTQLLKSMIDRRNSLIQEGVTPRIGMLKVPEVRKERPTYRLSPEESKFFNMDPNQELDEVSWRTYKTRYKQLTKPPKPTQSKKGSIVFNFGGEKVKQGDLDDLVKQYRQSAWKWKKTKKVDEYGDITQKSNVENLNRYLKKVDDTVKKLMESKDPKYLQELRDLGRFSNEKDYRDKYDKDKDEVNKTGSAILDKLNQIEF